MPARAISDLLVDFGSEPRLPRPVLAAIPEQREDHATAANVEHRIAEAVRQSEAQWRQEQTERWAAREAEIEAEHASRMRRLEALWAASAAETMMEQFTKLEQAVVERTGAAVAQILSPLLSEPLGAKAINQLAVKLQAVLADGTAVRLRVSGPAALYHALLAQLGETIARLDFVESEDIDLTLTIDDALYVTRLKSWSAELERVLA